MNNFSVLITLSSIPPNVWRGTMPGYPVGHQDGVDPYPPLVVDGNITSANIQSLTLSGGVPTGAHVTTTNAIYIPPTAGPCNLFFSVANANSPTQSINVVWGIVLLEQYKNTSTNRWSWGGVGGGGPGGNTPNQLYFNPSASLNNNQAWDYFIVISAIGPNGLTQYAVIDPKVTTHG